jgi:hypothetical protein
MSSHSVVRRLLHAQVYNPRGVLAQESLTLGGLLPSSFRLIGLAIGPTAGVPSVLNTVTIQGTGLRGTQSGLHAGAGTACALPFVLPSVAHWTIAHNLTGTSTAGQDSVHQCKRATCNIQRATDSVDCTSKRCMLNNARCMLHAARLHAVCCLLRGARCMLQVAPLYVAPTVGTVVLRCS